MVICMIKVLFVCHGNICRSPMAEFLFKDLVNKNKMSDKFEIASAATSYEEIGNPVHYGTKKILNSLGIDCSKKTARRMTIEDYNHYDYILLMDYNNLSNIKRIVLDDKFNKISLLLDFTNRENKNIKDPWYTGNFIETYNDVVEGLNCFYNYLIEQNILY